MSLFGAVADSYVTSVPASFAATVAALSPAAWYRLGEASGTTMADSSGNGHNGTYGTAAVLGVAGLLASDSDTAVQFAGNTLGTKANLVPYASWMDSPTALSLFMRISRSSFGSIERLIDRDDGSRRVWQFRLNAGKFEFVKVGGTGGVVTATYATSIADGTAHSAGATYDGANIRLYVDGVKVVTTAAVGNLGTAACALDIGAGGAGGTSNVYNGIGDEAVIANAVWTDANFSALHTAAIT